MAKKSFYFGKSYRGYGGWPEYMLMPVAISKIFKIPVFWEPNMPSAESEAQQFYDATFAAYHKLMREKMLGITNG